MTTPVCFTRLRHTRDPSVRERDIMRRTAPNMEHQILFHALGEPAARIVRRWHAIRISFRLRGRLSRDSGVLRYDPSHD